jgi:hypothetical protein
VPRLCAISPTIWWLVKEHSFGVVNVEPDDIAVAAVFLCLEAARYVTGHVLTVDGGWMGRCRRSRARVAPLQHAEFLALRRLVETPTATLERQSLSGNVFDLLLTDKPHFRTSVLTEGTMLRARFTTCLHRVFFAGTLQRNAPIARFGTRERRHAPSVLVRDLARSRESLIFLEQKLELRAGLPFALSTAREST